MGKLYLISVSMGYGHQRTAFPLKFLAEKWINANDYEGIPSFDKEIWEKTRNFYEKISRIKRFPLFGNFLFFLFDTFQKIPQFYPKRDLSRATFLLKTTYSLFKKGWMKDLFLKLKEKPLPVISTFFTPAFALEYFGYENEIFIVVCDADIARNWAPLEPKKTKIKYFVPTERVKERLILYGIPEKNIFLTGYPLPMENVGLNLEIVKEDLKNRLVNLDPKKKYFEKYQRVIENYLGNLPRKSDHPLTILFSMGGAGAQREIGFQILKNLKAKIFNEEIKLILSVGTNEKAKEYFEKKIENLKLKGKKFVEILFSKDIEDYFQKFNQTLRKTDILWTKPSELSFYSALGIPIIIAPPIGSQEEFNMRYLLKSGYGLAQENPRYLNQWLFDWLEEGYLAECAMEGFIEGEKLGAMNIANIVST